MFRHAAMELYYVHKIHDSYDARFVRLTWTLILLSFAPYMHLHAPLPAQAERVAAPLDGPSFCAVPHLLIRPWPG